VAIDTKRKTIQHLQGGIIREVLVREGDQVKEGQVLLSLEDGVVKANLEAVRQRYLGLRAMESRLLAEQVDRDRIDFHPDVLAEAKDPLIQRHVATQEQLWRTRRSALQADLAAIEESIRGQEAMRQSYAGMIESRRSQQRLLQEQLSNIRGLVSEGYASRNQQLELERQVAELTIGLTDLNGNMIRVGQAVAELRQRAASRRHDYRKESDAQLADVVREAQSDEGRLKALREELSRTEIRSPSDGQVVGLVFQTVGGVISPGQRVLDVVPEQEPLLLEARIQPHLINSVKLGLLADIRFSSFAHAPQLVVEGKVLSVSADLLSEQTAVGPSSYFLARVQVTQGGMRTLGHHMLYPLSRRMAASMTEH
jgi:protease secretion system membrane fusion protein